MTRFALEGDMLTATSISDDCAGRLETADGSYRKLALPETFNGETIFDRAIARGSFVDDIMHDVVPTRHSGCVSPCAEALMQDWSRKPNNRYEMVHSIYHHEPPAGGSIGELACTALYEIWTREIPGQDPSIVVDSGWILLESDCTYAPPITLPMYVGDVVSDTSGLSVFGGWPPSVGTEFPGWVGEGGAAHDNFRFCDDADKTAAGYCLPVCRDTELPDNGGVCTLTQP